MHLWIVWRDKLTNLKYKRKYKMIKIVESISLSGEDILVAKIQQDSVEQCI